MSVEAMLLPPGAAPVGLALPRLNGAFLSWRVLPIIPIDLSRFRNDGMDRLAAMRVFTAVADAGSLSAAGRRLNMPLATVSRHLAALEDEVGVRLMTRTTRHLALTEPGRHYLESCRRILAELEAADLALAGQHLETPGEIAITAPAMFGRRSEERRVGKECRSRWSPYH